jgi:hypothetical protein
VEKFNIITGENDYEKYKTLLDSHIEKQRLWFYGYTSHPLSYGSKKETDTHIYWSHTVKTPKIYNSKFFFKHENTSGITYDKKAKSIKIWFGQRYDRLIPALIDDVYKTFNAEWVLKIDPSFPSLINNTIFKRILKHKVNNVEDICRDYLKTCPYRNRIIDLNLFVKLLETGFNVKAFSNYFIVAEDCNDLLRYFLNGHGYSMLSDDIVRNGLILDRKVDFTKDTKYLEELNEDWKSVVEREKIINEFI